MRLLVGLLFSVTFITLLPTSAYADGLKIQPLEYKSTISAGDSQQGFVDISNPSFEDVDVKMSVQAFRQINDKGTLQFFDNEEISEGITPDRETFRLGSREAIRLYFLVDGTKLPTGDVFAALFATILPKDDVTGISQTIRVGTLLSFVNKTPGPRNAEITDLNIPFMHFSREIKGSYTIKNTADPKNSTGFYPEVTLTLDPIRAEHNQQSGLIFAGIAREYNFSVNEQRIGLYKLTASYQDSKKSQWVFVVTGVWRWLLLSIIIIVPTVLIIFMRSRKRGSRIKMKHVKNHN